MTHATRNTDFSSQHLHEVYVQSSQHEGFLNILIYRRISIWLALLAAKIHATPNQVTLLSFLASLLGIGMFLPGEFQLAALGLIPFHIGKILDCADGQLAKLTNQQSALGAFLDPFFDRVVDLLTLTALAIGYMRYTGSHAAIYLVLVFISAWFFSAYLDKYTETSEKALDTLRNTTKNVPPLLRKLLKWDGGFTGLIITLAVLFQLTIPVIGLFTLIALLPILPQLRKVYKKLRSA
jgi:phosphatidylglycerophosphate synthase